MLAVYFEVAIEYITMVAEGWFSSVIEDWRLFPWLLLGFAGFLLLTVLRFILRKVYR